MDWPQPNERLFVSGADWEHNACVVSYSESLSTYAWYYKEGADELIRSAVEDRSILDGGNRSHCGEQGRSSILAELGLHGLGQPVEYVAVLSATGLDHR